MWLINTEAFLVFHDDLQGTTVVNHLLWSLVAGVLLPADILPVVKVD